MNSAPSKPEGQEVSLISNIFRFQKLPINTIYGYFIDYNPEVDINNRDLRKFLVRQARVQIKTQIGEFFYYDFIISKAKLEEEFVVTAQGRDEIVYTLTIRYVSEIEPDCEHFIWYLNILVKLQQKNMGLVQITRKPSFFNKNQAIELRSIGLSIWNGYKATINPVRDNILMTLDVCSKIINNKNVLEAIEEIKDYNIEIRKKKINDLLVNQIIMTKYNKLFYRVAYIDYDSNPDSTFAGKYETISYRKYMQDQYNLPVRSARQPLIVSVQKGQEKKLIPEFCYLTGIPERAKRDGNAMRQVRDANNSNPNDRYKAIKAHAEKMQSGNFLEFADNQQLVVQVPSIMVKAYELPPVRIQLKDETIECGERGFNVRGPIRQSVPIPHLRIIHSRDDHSNVSVLEKTLRSRFSISGIIVELIDVDQYSSDSELHSLLSNIRSSKVIPTIILVLLQRRDGIYNEIKQLALNADLPIQCLLSSQFRKDRKIESVLTNLTHQIAAKTGSQIWSVPYCEGIPKITMIVGMDVHHDTVNKRESVLGFSASLNPEFTKYYSTIRKQEKVGEEISAAVEGCFREAIVNFFEETKKRFLPSLIIVYRDGVSETQEEFVRSIEIQGLKKIISEFKDYSPEIIYLVVRKGVNQRFFTGRGGNYVNPKAGTLVLDESICDENEFYLITSTVTQGNAAPVKYRIIENSSNVPKAVLAKFSYSLCHLYFNWKGPIKIPVPIQLSHKIAYLVGESVHRDAGMGLRKSLWYL